MPRPNLSASSSNIKLWLLFLLALIFFMVLAPLVQRGCFIDGMLYKTVAYNYAEGQGSFWTMKFTNTSMFPFCEQPPLYFFLLGNLYKLTGEHFFTDRFFTSALFLIFAMLLFSVARQIFKRPGPYALLILFFLLTIPVFCWSYVNQIIEPLLCVLVMLCLLFFVRFIHSGKNVFMLLFGLSLFLLFLGKGFQSCFMIVLPLTYMFLTRFKKANYFFTLATGLILLGLLVACFKLSAPAAAWLDCYYKSRLVLTMNNVGNTTDNHFEIIGRLFSELILCLGFVVILCLYLKLGKKYPLRFILRNFISNKLAVALLLTAFAGSFPYALSLVQRGFYLIPAFVCFVIAVVYGLRRYWLFLFRPLSALSNYKIVRLLFPALSLVGLIYFFMSFGLYKRNKELLKDIHEMLPYFKKGETVLIDTERWNDFSMHAYLYMEKEISLSVERSGKHYLIRSRSFQGQSPDSLIKINLNTQEIDLYRIGSAK